MILPKEACSISGVESVVGAILTLLPVKVGLRERENTDSSSVSLSPSVVSSEDLDPALARFRHLEREAEGMPRSSSLVEMVRSRELAPLL